MAEKRAPAASPGGKRRILRSQDSFSEPPRKSPLALGESHLGVDLGNLALTSSMQQKWRVSPFHVAPDATMRNVDTLGDASNLVDDFHMPVDGECSGVKHEGNRFSEQYPSTNMAQTQLQPPSQARRRSSIDILDDFKMTRRRSSCKPGFKPAEPLISVTEDEEQAKEAALAMVSSPLLTRSISAEGFGPGAFLDQRQDTQALLFDSTPDLTIEENYFRFPSLRIQRRGAVCYPDLEHPLLMFNQLALETGVQVPRFN